MTLRRILRAVLLVAGMVALTALTSCTSEDLARFIAWHETDPTAAVEFANRPEVQAQLQQATSSTNSEADDWGKWEPILQCESGGDWSTPHGQRIFGRAPICSFDVACLRRAGIRRAGLAGRTVAADQDR